MPEISPDSLLSALGVGDAFTLMACAVVAALLKESSVDKTVATVVPLLLGAFGGLLLVDTFDFASRFTIFQKIVGNGLGGLVAGRVLGPRIASVIAPRASNGL